MSLPRLLALTAALALVFARSAGAGAAPGDGFWGLKCTRTNIYEPDPASEIAADMASAGITDLRTATPEQRAAFNQLSVARERRMLDAETAFLTLYRSSLDNFYRDFPNPADRDVYVGWVRRPVLEWMAYIRDNLKFAQFVNDLRPFETLDDIKQLLPASIVVSLAGKVPTGHEDYATQFEQRLFNLDVALDQDLAFRDAISRMSVGELTPAWRESVNQKFAQERACRETPAALAAMGLWPPPAATPAAIAPPVAPLARAQPPPTAPETPLVIYGHTPAPPPAPPMAADAPPPAPPVYSTPYLAQQPDGSTVTYILLTNRPLSPGEAANYAASQGQQFAGLLEAPPPAPPGSSPGEKR
jgi:hypothetical protein